jgi:hypothetical protein
MNCVVVMGIHMKNTQLADTDIMIHDRVVQYNTQLSEQQANESVCRLDHVTNTVHYSLINDMCDWCVKNSFLLIFVFVSFMLDS